MKSILLPTDFSNNALHAIQYTAELFKNEPCKFYLLHVHQASAYISDDLMHVPTSESIHKILVDNAKTALSDLVNQLNLKNNPNHDFLMLVDYDNFIDAINQICQVHNIDLIAMGMQGKSAAEQVLFGSHTIRVIQRLDMPTLVVPESYNFNKLDKVILSIKNYKTFINSCLDIFNSIQALHGFTIDALNFNTTDSEADFTTILNKKLANIAYDMYPKDAKDSFNAIEKHIDDNDIDLLVMGSEKHSFFERLFTKHAVETFAYNIKRPLLVLGQNSQ